MINKVQLTIEIGIPPYKSSTQAYERLEELENIVAETIDNSCKGVFLGGKGKIVRSEQDE